MPIPTARATKGSGATREHTATRSIRPARSRRIVQAPEHEARVLLAEDDPDMRALLARALRRIGYSVVEVQDGLALLQRVRSGLDDEHDVAPDLIISDIRMPGCSGLEVLAGLRACDWAMPVILITAFGDEAAHAEARRLGAALLLDKPFDLDDLLHVAQAIIPPRF